MGPLFTEEAWVPHLLAQKPWTATSSEVKRTLIALTCRPPLEEANALTPFIVSDFPAEHFSSITSFPTDSLNKEEEEDNEEDDDDEEASSDSDSVLAGRYSLPTASHQSPTAGRAPPRDGDVSEAKKSVMTALWAGLKLPYHMMLTEKRPLKSVPLWYRKLMLPDDSASVDPPNHDEYKRPTNII